MTKKLISRILSFLGIIVVLLFVFGMTNEVNAQNQISTDIAERLEQQGVPVKQVVTINRLPYEIEIALKSSSNDNQLSVDDNWFMQLARREATFAYRISSRLSSFKLTVYNASDELIYSTQTYLYPQDLDQQIPPKLPIVDAQEARAIVANQLQPGELTIDRLEVNLENVSGNSGQVLVIQVSGENLEEVNLYLPNFLGSLFRILDIANEEYGTTIVICHLRVLDGKGNVLLDYVKDVESGSTQWTSAQGVYHDWFPQPTGPDTKSSDSTSIIEQDAYPAPIPEDGAKGDDASNPTHEALPYP